MSFRDHFSRQARSYAAHRPRYPADLFDYLAGLAASNDLAWDCGTGNGQAAIQLARRFSRVIATDASARQIENAFPHDRVSYRVEPAERTSIPSSSLDLITVGTAVHWFDFKPFYAEARRVGRPGAILAVWTYHLPIIDPGVDRVLERYYKDILAGYWPDGFHYLDERYLTLPFPFEEIQPPQFFMEAEWELDDLIGFLDTWSATRRYIEDQGRHPLDDVIAELRTSWGEQTRPRTIRWPLYFRIGRLAD